MEGCLWEEASRSGGPTGSLSLGLGSWVSPHALLPSGASVLWPGYLQSAGALLSSLVFLLVDLPPP